MLVAQGAPLTDAYRQTHNPVTDRRQTVYDNASKLAKRCADFIRAARDQINEQAIVNAADLRTRQSNIAHAPALTHTKAFNCRYCPTDGKHYTYFDWVEFADAVDQAAADKRPQPSSAGGVGFDAFAPPNPRCRRCRGVGERFVYGPQDTTALDPELAAGNIAAIRN